MAQLELFQMESLATGARMDARRIKFVLDPVCHIKTMTVMEEDERGAAHRITVTITKVNPEMQQVRDALNDYLVDGKCPTGQDESSMARRDSWTANYRLNSNSSDLARRSQSKSTASLDFAITILVPLLTKLSYKLSPKEQKEAND